MGDMGEFIHGDVAAVVGTAKVEQEGQKGQRGLSRVRMRLAWWEELGKTWWYRWPWVWHGRWGLESGWAMAGSRVSVGEGGENFGHLLQSEREARGKFLDRMARSSAEFRQWIPAGVSSYSTFWLVM
jgi:hypothetical protein